MPIASNIIMLILIKAFVFENKKKNQLILISHWQDDDKEVYVFIELFHLTVSLCGNNSYDSILSSIYYIEDMR